MKGVAKGTKFSDLSPHRRMLPFVLDKLFLTF
jgi:hypothetical protein